MTEYSVKRGFDGKDQFCSLCSRECTYINDFLPLGDNQSKAVTFGREKLEPADNQIGDQDAASAQGVDIKSSFVMSNVQNMDT